VRTAPAVAAAPAGSWMLMTRRPRQGKDREEAPGNGGGDRGGRGYGGLLLSAKLVCQSIRNRTQSIPENVAESPLVEGGPLL
jgi:hypothetical protein